MAAPILFTIGFAGKSAERFFELLRTASVRMLIDVRLHNDSQLAGYAKRDDLRYFLKQILNCDYIHLLNLAPTENLLQASRNKKLDWGAYEVEFTKLMEDRNVCRSVTREQLTSACLLCSEHLPDKCHRRLLAERFAKVFDLTIEHLI